MGEVGIPDNFFWSMSWRDIDRLIQARARMEEREYWRAGQVAAAFCNALGAKKTGSSTPWQPWDFFPQLDKYDPTHVDYIGKRWRREE